MSQILSQSKLRGLTAEWLASGKTVAGPARVKPDLVLYRALRSEDELLLDGFLRPANSIKEFVFPKTEKLYGYKIRGNRIELIENDAPEPQQVILAARPCDAAALPVLDHVFNWDFHDEFYNRRRAATTVITLACNAHDENCFCTSVGLDPSSERGSDALLIELGSGQYEVRCITEKGHALFDGKTEKSDRTGLTSGGPVKRFDPQVVEEFVTAHFEDPFWKDHALTCIGCGTCAFSCPACHCFDIVDAGPAAGNARVKTWDSCQFSTFTAHASGHNPRPWQLSRQRQRILHKFAIYPKKFGEILCTGCGNCARNCPVGLGVLNVVSEIHHA